MKLKTELIVMIITALLFISGPLFAANAYVGVFGSISDTECTAGCAQVVEQESNPGPIMFGVTFGDRLFAGAELFTTREDVGGDILAGFKVGTHWKISGGVGIMPSTSIAYTDPGSSNPLPAKSSGDSQFVFADVEYRGFFARYSHTTADFTHSASKQTGVDGMGDPIFSTFTAASSLESNATWLGYRFSF